MFLSLIVVKAEGRGDNRVMSRVPYFFYRRALNVRLERNGGEGESESVENVGDK